MHYGFYSQTVEAEFLEVLSRNLQLQINNLGHFFNTCQILTSNIIVIQNVYIFIIAIRINGVSHIYTYEEHVKLL